MLNPGQTPKNTSTNRSLREQLGLPQGPELTQDGIEGRFDEIVDKLPSNKLEELINGDPREGYFLGLAKARALTSLERKQEAERLVKLLKQPPPEAFSSKLAREGFQDDLVRLEKILTADNLVHEVNVNARSLKDRERLERISQNLVSSGADYACVRQGGDTLLEVKSNRLHGRQPMMSSTKSLGAILTFAAVEDGLLTPSDSLNEFFDDKIFKPSPEKGNIRVADLLHHTSGYPRNAPDKTGYTTEALLRVPLEAEPQKKFQYSNLACQILGRIVQQRIEIDLQEYLYRKVLYPLGIPSEDLRLWHTGEWAGFHEGGWATPEAFFALSRVLTDEGAGVLKPETVQRMLDTKQSPAAARNRTEPVANLWWNKYPHVFSAEGTLDNSMWVRPCDGLVLLRTQQWPECPEIKGSQATATQKAVELFSQLSPLR